MDDVRAVLLAGGVGRRMGRLGDGRLKPLIPFGGTCRLIDFSLANAQRSGLTEVLLLAQHEERQLMDDLYRVWWRPGFRVHFGPHQDAYARAARLGGARGARAAPTVPTTPPEPSPPTAPSPPTEPSLPPLLDTPAGPPERGTADALIRKAPYIFGPGTAQVMVLHADHVYRLNYRGMLAAHRLSGAALTVSYQRIERRYVHLFGMVEFEPDGRLRTFREKPPVPTSDLVFAAFCVFDARVLHRYLELLDGTTWQHDLSRDVIPAMLDAGEHIRGYRVTGYWEDIGTIERYHRAHLSLLAPRPTMTTDQMPSTIASARHCRLVTTAPGVRRSIVPSDLVNEGRLDESVVFPGVRIGAGATVRSSVLLPGASVPAGAVVDSAIVTESGAVQPAGTPATR